MEDTAGAARNELLRFSRDANGRAEQRARRRIRMCHASRMRCAAQRTGITLRPAAIFEQRHGLRNGEDLRAGADQSKSIGAGFVAAAFRSPAFWGSAEAPANVHTQRFAFRASEESDESVKMSNTTSRRASAVTPALVAAHPRLNRVQNTNFDSITINPLPAPTILRLAENKALKFFYSVQMKSHQPRITNHKSRVTRITTHQSLITNHGDCTWPKN
jgi:hypothetical protein